MRLAARDAGHWQERRCFPHGIFWVTLGQEPNIAELQRELARQLGGKGDSLSVESGKEELRQLLKARSALLVLDDVWKREHAEAFVVPGPLGRVLLTTREPAW